MIRTSLELQLMMLPEEGDSTHRPPHHPCSARETGEEPERQSPAPETLGGDPTIGTPEKAIQGLRALSREARALREGLSRLSEGEEFGQPSAQQHLHFGQTALDDASAIFELLARQLENG